MSKIFAKSLTSLVLALFTIALVAQDSINKDSIITKKVFQYERADFTIEMTSGFSNPYDASEIALDMLITTPSGKNLVLPCFYISGNSAKSLWNARFTPIEAGTYKYTYRLNKSNATIATSPENSYLVSATAKDGFLHANNNWTFIYDSGKPVRGIGENIGWEARSWENQKYTYNYFLPKLSKYGVNFYRMWMCPWNVPVEWKTVSGTNFYTNSSAYFNPSGIKRMDEVVELADANGVHFMMSIDAHGALIAGSEWNSSNYNSANGGPVATPLEFFTSAAAKAKYKNKLRYLVARWGYSPAVGVWEFFNELDNATYAATPQIPDAIITAWHKEMSAYLSSIDCFNHLISTSVSHRDIAGMNDVPDMDFNQKHIYKSTDNIPTTLNSYTATHKKPYVIGEFGYEWDWTVNFSTITPELIHDLKKGLWYGVFNSTPILPMTWWWEFFDEQNMSYYYKGVREISDRMLLAGSGNFSPITAITAGSFKKYAVKCGTEYFIYVLNQGAGSLTSNVVLSGVENATYTVQIFNPTEQTYSTPFEITGISTKLTIPSVTLAGKSDLILIIKKADDISGKRIPFSGTAVSLPGTVEAENFDIGGETFAYHDLDTANIPNKYRLSEGVDIEDVSGGGYCISNMVKGEWLKYSIEIASSGTYKLDIKLAAAEVGKTLRIFIDNTDISGTVSVATTSGLSDWQTISVNTPLLNKGSKTLKILVEESDLVLDNLTFTILNKAPVVSITTPVNNDVITGATAIDLTADASDEDGSISKVEYFEGTVKIGQSIASPYTVKWNPPSGNHTIKAIATDNAGLSTNSATVSIMVSIVIPALFIPGKIEMEHFDTGAEGTAYHDITAGNKFGFYRQTDVDIEECTDGGNGYSLGEFATGEWVRYTAEVAQTGEYDIEFRVATSMANTAFSLFVDGIDVTGKVIVPNTTSWTTWKSLVVRGIPLTQGKRVIKFVSLLQFFNVNSMTFSASTGVNTWDINNFQLMPNPVKNILTIKNNFYKEGEITVTDITSKNIMSFPATASTIDVSALKAGLYFFNLKINGKLVKSFKIFKE